MSTQLNIVLPVLTTILTAKETSDIESDYWHQILQTDPQRNLFLLKRDLNKLIDIDFKVQILIIQYQSTSIRQLWERFISYLAFCLNSTTSHSNNLINKGLSTTNQPRGFVYTFDSDEGIFYSFYWRKAYRLCCTSPHNCKFTKCFITNFNLDSRVIHSLSSSLLRFINSLKALMTYPSSSFDMAVWCLTTASL